MSRRFNFKLDNGTQLSIKPPTVRQYYKGLLSAKNDPELFQAVADICSNNDDKFKVTEEYVIDNFTVDDFNRFLKNIHRWVSEERNADPN